MQALGAARHVLQTVQGVNNDTAMLTNSATPMQRNSAGPGGCPASVRGRRIVVVTAELQRQLPQLP